MKLPAPTYHVRHRSSALWSSVPDIPAHEVSDDPSYGPALSVAAEHVGEADAIRCVHCEVPLRVWTDPQGRPWWIHVGIGGTFQCRGEHGMILDGQYATPPSGTPPLPGSPVSLGESSPDPAPAWPPRPCPPVVASYPTEPVDGFVLGHPGAA